MGGTGSKKTGSKKTGSKKTGPEDTGARASENQSALPSVGQILEDLCDDFEQRWKKHQRPRIETFLARIGPAQRRQLLSHLIGMEIYWRRQLGESPFREEYLQRFPDDRAIIQQQFSATTTETRPPRSQSMANAETLVHRSCPDGDRREEDLPQPVRCLGNYRLLNEIGRGGMGVVYRAWQPSADRFVALKVIRRDRLDSLPARLQASVIDRFRQEAQATGRIEHDHIVTIYEVGEIEGEHFFSMRYVDGRSLFEVLKDGPLDGRRIAQYLEPVARGLHEAHQHGILHRDLKPQNILVDAKTDRALLADFGLAKLAQVAEGATQAGEVMGTPAYMSPEQAHDSSRVTAKSDVYALGATIYHMLIGQPPFQGTTVLETIRKVTEVEPKSPRELNPAVDRDLDTICLKCLEKDPARRYGSAEALADDLRHYLNGEPIAARPVSPAEQVWRCCRRNPLLATSMAAAGLFLIVALIATSVGYFKTSASLAIAQREREKAEESDRELLSAGDHFFTQVSENELMDRPGMQPLRQEFLEEASAFYQRFLRQRGEDPTIRDELAATHFRVGRIRELIQSQDEALVSYRRAYEMQKDLVARRPNGIVELAALGNTANRMGRVMHRQQEYEQAMEKYHEAILLRKRLIVIAPDEVEYPRKLANTTMNLALIERDRQDWERARGHLSEAQAIRMTLLETRPNAWEVRRDWAAGHYNLATLEILASQNEQAQSNFEAAKMRLKSAEPHLEAAIAAFSVILEQRPNSLENKFRLATCYRVFADVKSELHDGRGAILFYGLAKEQMATLVLANPEVAMYRATLAGLYMNLGWLHKEELQRFDKAGGNYEEALSILGPLVRDFPATPRYREDMAVTLRELASLPKSTGQNLKAGQRLRDAYSHFKKLVDAHPDNVHFQAELEATRKLLTEVELSAP